MIETVHLPGDVHGDPADRMLAATARVLGATLVTKDHRLIQYSKLRHVRAIEA
jgi:PIN domain nuclease of toxin-antitoxin system